MLTLIALIFKKKEHETSLPGSENSSISNIKSKIKKNIALIFKEQAKVKEQN
jgi:hypothetical protein